VLWQHAFLPDVSPHSVHFTEELEELEELEEPEETAGLEET
jgi:hypothetical protein